MITVKTQWYKMALEEIKEKFVGVWKLDRSENFQEFLQEVGKN